MSIAAVFTITKLWIQPRCLSRDEWIKKVLYKNTLGVLNQVAHAYNPSYSGGKDWEDSG
jgi:hypothetical protein